MPVACPKHQPDSTNRRATPRLKVPTFVTAVISPVTKVIGPLASRQWKRRVRPPLEVTVEHVHKEPWAIALQSLPAEDEWLQGNFATGIVADWLIGSGGADVSDTFLELSIASRSQGDVVISDLKPFIRSKPPCIAGTSVYCASAGAGTAIKIGFDLDAHEPVALELKEGDYFASFDPAGPYFRSGKHIVVAPGEIVKVLIHARAAKANYTWDLIATVATTTRRTNREPWRIPLNDARKPFRTTGRPNNGYESEMIWAWHEGGILRPASAAD